MEINRRKTISLPNNTLLRLFPFTPDPDRPPEIRLFSRRATHIDLTHLVDWRLRHHAGWLASIRGPSSLSVLYKRHSSSPSCCNASLVLPRAKSWISFNAALASSRSTVYIHIYIGRLWLDCDVELLLVRIPFLCEEQRNGIIHTGKGERWNLSAPLACLMRASVCVYI